MKSVFYGISIMVLIGFSVASIDEAAAAVGDRLTVSRSNVNVRSGPTLQDSVILIVNPGEAMIEIDTSGDWYLVEFPSRNQRGWVYAPLVNRPSGASAAPTSSAASVARATAEAARAQAQPQPVREAQPVSPPSAVGRLSVSRSNVNVRTGPTLQDEVVAIIDPGEEIIELDQRGEWYHVDLPDRNARGWIFSDLLDRQPGTPAPQPSTAAAAPAAPATREPPRAQPRLTPQPVRQAEAFGAARQPFIQGDPENGERVFYKCGACHATTRGVNSTGPSLWGVVDSAPAQVPGFGYSPGMRQFAAQGGVWDEATLDEFIRRPRRLVEGTSMPYSGIRDPKERRDLIAYLRRLDS